MTLIDKKITVLVKIGRALNKENISWSLGASAMLYLRGYVNYFDDIDIMVSEPDVEKTKHVLDILGTREAKASNPNYKTKVYLEYNIDNIEVDIMAGLIIVSDDMEYYFPLKEEEGDEINIDEVIIHIDSVELWLNYYTLMNRIDKVEIINRRKNLG